MPPEDETARGVAVQPVSERGGAWHAEPQIVEMILEARAAFRASVHRHSGRLIDDQHQPVAMEDPFDKVDGGL